MSSSERLMVSGLSAAWGHQTVLEHVDLTVGRSELIVLMGPNGSGKTTLLRCIAGLEDPTAGVIRLDGEDLRGVPAHRRGIGMLFQEPSLFDTRTVAQNIAYGLELARRAPAEIDARVAQVAERLEITPLLRRSAHELSGGERQRVALARTIAPRPRLVLLDEPMASVDPTFRQDLRSDFRRVLRDEGVSALYVTHDREEGLFLADRVLLLFRGSIRASGAPSDVFAHPISEEVAQFLGYNVVDVGGGRMAVHPEEIELTAEAEGDMRGTVRAIGTIGPRSELELGLDDGRRLIARIPPSTNVQSVGARVGIRFRNRIPLSPGAPAEHAPGRPQGRPPEARPRPRHG